MELVRVGYTGSCVGSDSLELGPLGLASSEAILRYRPERITAHLAELGYPTLEHAGDHISGVVSGVDLSDAARAPPERPATGPFATLEEPGEHVPAEIQQACLEAGATLEVLGTGGYSVDSHLHLYIEAGADRN